MTFPGGLAGSERGWRQGFPELAPHSTFARAGAPDCADIWAARAFASCYGVNLAGSAAGGAFFRLRGICAPFARASPRFERCDSLPSAEPGRPATSRVGAGRYFRDRCIEVRVEESVAGSVCFLLWGEPGRGAAGERGGGSYIAYVYNKGVWNQIQ